MTEMNTFPDSGDMSSGPESPLPVDQLLKRGLAAQNDGNYPLAISMFKKTLSNSPVEEEAVVATFTALRQVAISQFLIDRFLKKFDWSPDDYLGFDDMEAQLPRESIPRSLEELLQVTSRDSLLGATMGMNKAMDIFAQTGELTLDSYDPEDYKSALWLRKCYLDSLGAMEEGNLEFAKHLLNLVIRENPLSGPAYLLLGKISYEEGSGKLAIASMNLAFRHPHESWQDHVDSMVHPVIFGTYKEFRIILYKLKFFAVPDTDEYFLSSIATGGNVTLCHNRITSRVRKKLLHVLPSAVVSILRRMVYATPLRNYVIEATPFGLFFNAKDLRTIVHAVDQGEARRLGF